LQEFNYYRPFLQRCSFTICFHSSHSSHENPYKGEMILSCRES